MKATAFTLTELLIVIGIIAVLLAILLPTLNVVKQTALRLQCSSQLRQIGAAVQMYANAYRGTLSASKYGNNWLKTNSTTRLLELIDPQGTRAYWGVAYAPFLISRGTLDLRGTATSNITHATYGIWHCPSTVMNDPSARLGPDEPVTYGINGLITGSILPKWRKITRYKNASETVFAEDSVKSQMANNEADTLSDFGLGSNLTQWRPGGDGYALNPDAYHEYYRHQRYGNILWLDGHVSSVHESLGQDMPSSCYLSPYEN